jgi:hypothetical protein
VLRLQGVNSERKGTEAKISDKLRTYAKVRGKMVDLRSEAVIWDRSEFIGSDNEYSLEEYKVEEGKILKEILEKLLRKVAFRLASDILYAE